MAPWRAAATRFGAGAIFALCAVDQAGAQGPPACASLSGGRLPAEVAGTVAEELRLPPTLVRPESRLAEDLGADELSRLEVVMALERRFGIRIDERIERLARNVRGLAEQVSVLLGRRCGGQGG
jgi:acyl carrier protein